VTALGHRVCRADAEVPVDAETGGAEGKEAEGEWFTLKGCRCPERASSGVYLLCRVPTLGTLSSSYLIR
jgi:hypothetical protein